jgi:hypothetical protein
LCQREGVLQEIYVEINDLVVGKSSSGVARDEHYFALRTAAILFFIGARPPRVDLGISKLGKGQRRLSNLGSKSIWNERELDSSGPPTMQKPG